MRVKIYTRAVEDINGRGLHTELGSITHILNRSP